MAARLDDGSLVPVHARRGRYAVERWLVADGDGAFEQRLGFGVPAQVGQLDGQVVEGDAHIGVVRAERRLAYLPTVGARFDVTDRDRELELVTPIGSFPFGDARSETAAEKPAFRTAARDRRCLIPASGFYEWTKDGAGNRLPWYFRPPEGGIVAFAGVWQDWERGEDRFTTCAIVTTEANERMSAIHHRQPVTLRPEDWAELIVEAPSVEDPVFGFQVPQKCEDIPDSVLDPASSWGSPGPVSDTASRTISA